MGINSNISRKLYNERKKRERDKRKEQNPELFKSKNAASMREWRRLHPAAHVQGQKRWKSNNPDKCKKHWMKWYSTHKDQVREYRNKNRWRWDAAYFTRTGPQYKSNGSEYHNLHNYWYHRIFKSLSSPFGDDGKVLQDFIINELYSDPLTILIKNEEYEIIHSALNLFLSDREKQKILDLAANDRREIIQNLLSAQLRDKIKQYYRTAHEIRSSHSDRL